MRNILTSVQITLPSGTFKKLDSFINLFENTNKKDKHIDFDTSPDKYLPQISIGFSDNVSVPCATFLSDNKELMELNISNETGHEWKSPYNYKQVPLATIISRLSKNQISFQYYDHIGFNLPWQDGIHPKIKKLIKLLTPLSLFHPFPRNDDWYFIIPGSTEEILKTAKVDYAIDRKPKFEIVNFKSCSTPLIQIDLAINQKYEDTRKMFPEAIFDDNLRNLWVYVENSSGIDICLVLNEIGHGWTSFFANSRLT